jgi:hypothetical protein
MIFLRVSASSVEAAGSGVGLAEITKSQKKFVNDAG